MKKRNFKKIKIKAMVFIFGLIGIILLLTNLLADEEVPNFSGYIVTRVGKTVTFTRARGDHSKLFCFKYGPEDKKTKIPLATVKEIIFGEGSKTALVKLKDGRTMNGRCLRFTKYSNAFWGSNYDFHFSYFDDVAGNENDDFILFKDMARLVIDEPVGRFRRCPHCNATWPDSYLFCPNDGTVTVWGEPTGTIVTGEANVFQDVSLMEILLNACLDRAGYDPTSDEAKLVKDFIQLWLNPIADQIEIQKKLDELRKQFLEIGEGR